MLAAVLTVASCGGGSGQLVGPGVSSQSLTSADGDLSECPTVEPASGPSSSVDLSVVGTTGPRGEFAVEVTNASDAEVIVSRERYALLAAPGAARASTRPPDWEIATDNLPDDLQPGQTTTVFASVTETPCGSGELSQGTYDIVAVVLVRHPAAGTNERLTVRATYEVD